MQNGAERLAQKMKKGGFDPHRLLLKKESVQSVVNFNISIINLSIISCWCFDNNLHVHWPMPPKGRCIVSGLS